VFQSNSFGIGVPEHIFHIQKPSLPEPREMKRTYLEWWEKGVQRVTTRRVQTEQGGAGEGGELSQEE